MLAAHVKTSQEATWRQATAAIALRDRVRRVLDTLPMAYREMRDRLHGLIPSIDFYVFHGRDIEAGYALEIEDTLRRAEAIYAEHSRDEDCDVDPESDCCRLCGVYHGDPCPECRGRGFHVDGCSEVGIL